MCQDDVELLHSKFLCCYNVSLINFEETLKSISWEEQKLLIDQTIHHNLNIIAPIKRSYQISFLKQIIKYLESKNLEIHDAIYEHLCSLHATSLNEENFTFKHYVLPIFDTTISLKESSNFVCNGTTGLCSWQASLALSDWLIQNKSTISKKDVLELGSGTGLCGLISSKCCRARKVIMSDGSSKVMELLKYNLERNYTVQDKKLLNENYNLYQIDKAQQIGTFFLPWEKIETLSLENVISPEIILAADVIYDSSMFQALSNALIYLFNYMRNSCTLILSATVRNEVTLASFLKILDQLGFLMSEQAVTNRFMYWDTTTPIKIFVITRNKSLQ